MTAPLAVGIVGAGVIGALHARVLGGLAGARVAAVAEPREAEGQALATAHGAAWYPDLETMLARAAMDVVVLATPSGLHADQALRAARAGKHVITEKPMAITLADADRMIAGCRAAGVALAVIFQTRFIRDALRLKRAVEAGLFGQIILGNAFVHWHRPASYYAASGGWRGTLALDGGGALMNQSIHTIDLLQWTVGPVASLAAFAGTLAHQIEAEDTASATLRFASGALGVIQGSTAASEDWPVRLEIVGTAGRATLEGGSLKVWQPEREVDDAELLSPAELAMTAGWRPDEGFGVAHERQLRAIFQAIQAGETPPVAGEEARKAVEIILAIYQAAKSGAMVALPVEGVAR